MTSIIAESMLFRRATEIQLRSMLRSGELIASGLAAPVGMKSQREDIPTPLWEVLELDIDACEARAPGFRLVGVKVREACEADQEGIPEANTSLQPREGSEQEFHHAPTYEWVTIRGSRFVLDGRLREIVRLLHDASKRPDPWISGKRLTQDAGYSTMDVSGLFKRHKQPDWRELIEGDGRGNFRLHLKGSGQQA